MKNLAAFGLAVVLAVPGAHLFAQAGTYNIDPNHTEVDFSIKHMAISTVHGRFAVKSGTIHLNAADVTKSSVEAVIDVTSVDTNTPKRDADLKSPKFFDAEKFPMANFKSTKVTSSGDGYELVGDLTLHGVTKPVTLHLDQPSKEQTGPDGKQHRGFSATGTIHRQDFGLTWNGTMKSGDSVLGDDVKLTLEVEAIAAAAQ